MNKELTRLKEVLLRSSYFEPIVYQAINAFEDKPDARVIDVLRHMIAAADVPENHTASMLCHIAEAQVLTMAELLDAAKEVRKAYLLTWYPLEEHGSERDLLRRYTSDEDVRTLIERSHEKFIWRTPYKIYTWNNTLKLDDRVHSVTLVAKGLSVESVLEVMVHSSNNKHKNRSKSLCIDVETGDAQSYDVYEEVLRDGLCLDGRSLASTDTLEPYRPLTREEFEAVRLAIQITQ